PPQSGAESPTSTRPPKQCRTSQSSRRCCARRKRGSVWRRRRLFELKAAKTAKCSDKEAKSSGRAPGSHRCFSAVFCCISLFVAALRPERHLHRNRRAVAVALDQKRSTQAARPLIHVAQAEAVRVVDL